MTLDFWTRTDEFDVEKRDHPSDSLESLQAENARLIALLESHGIAWQQALPTAFAAREPKLSRISTAEKWDKRQRGYKAMGYRISLDEAVDISTPALNFSTLSA